MPGRQDIADLAGRLVAIDSVNPALVPGAPGEGEIAGFIAGHLQRSGAKAEIVAAGGVDSRPSVLGILPGTGKGRSLLLYAHLDTVGVGGAESLRKPVFDGDRLVGRGALDMKGSLAVVLSVVRECAALKLPGDLVIAAVSDEEGSSVGMEAVVRRLAQKGYTPDAAIVTEPTQLRFCLAHRGFVWATITTSGRASHSALPDKGVDAIARMGRVLAALEKLDRSYRERPAHPMLGYASVLATLIRGGSELFTTPAECRIDVVRRTLPGESGETVRAEIEGLLDAERAKDPKFAGTCEIKLDRAPLETFADSPVAALLAASAEKVLGRCPESFGAPYWTDAGLLAEAGIPTVIFGPSGEGLHADLEWVSLSSLEALADILTDTVKSFCG